MPKPSIQRVALKYLEKKAYRSKLKETDEGFDYVGRSTYSERDVLKMWEKGAPFHYILDLGDYKGMEEAEFIVQVFPKEKYAEVHLKGITDEDESDGNFITYHGQTLFMSVTVSEAEELKSMLSPSSLNTNKMESIYWQVVDLG